MAKLSAHPGAQSRIVDFGYKKRTVGNDGIVLVNHGGGWKLRGKLKAHVSPDEHMRHMFADTEKPATRAYIDALRNITGSLPRRSMLHMIIGMMPTDADGVWSEYSDYCALYAQGEDADFTDIQSACRAYCILRNIS